MTVLFQLPRPSLAMPVRAVPVVFALVMSLLVTGSVSALLTGVNTGLEPGFVSRWLQSFSLAWLAAFPLVYLIGPRLRQALQKVAR